jgi:hypothetical protein
MLEPGLSHRSGVCHAPEIGRYREGRGSETRTTRQVSSWERREYFDLFWTDDGPHLHSRPREVLERAEAISQRSGMPFAGDPRMMTRRRFAAAANAAVMAQLPHSCENGKLEEHTRKMALSSAKWTHAGQVELPISDG